MQAESSAAQENEVVEDTTVLETGFAAALPKKASHDRLIPAGQDSHNGAWSGWITRRFALCPQARPARLLVVEPAELVLVGDVEQAQRAHAHGEQIHVHQAQDGPQAEGHEHD